MRQLHFCIIRIFSHSCRCWLSSNQNPGWKSLVSMCGTIEKGGLMFNDVNLFCWLEGLIWRQSRCACHFCTRMCALNHWNTVHCSSSDSFVRLENSFRMMWTNKPHRSESGFEGALWSFFSFLFTSVFLSFTSFLFMHHIILVWSESTMLWTNCFLFWCEAFAFRG